MKKSKPYVFAVTLLAASVNLYAASSAEITQIGLIDSEHYVAGRYTSTRGGLNSAGQVMGYAARYSGTTYMGNSVWLYDGNTNYRIGLTNAEHRRNDGYTSSGSFYINNAGQVAGNSRRYNGGSTWIGSSAWISNGTSTTQVGLTGAGYTRDDGYQENALKAFNNAGQLLGTALRYNGATGNGQSSWLSTGAGTVNIGLTDAGHTRADGYQYSFSNRLNDAGQVAGVANRYNGSASSGNSAWTYNGSSTVAIGLIDATHTGIDGYQSNGVQSINAAGQVFGHTQRYNGGSASMGQSAWRYNGTSTEQVGLTDAINTRDDGYQYNYIQGSNDAGQMAGYANRYNGSIAIGTSAWVDTGSSTRQVGLTDAAHTKSTDGYQSSFVDVLNNNAQAVGQSSRYSAGGAEIGSSAWIDKEGSSVEIGLMDAQHTSSADQRTSDVTHLNDAGQAAGNADRFNTGSLYYGLGGQSAWAYDGANSVQIGLTDAAHTKVRSSDADWQNNEVVAMNEAGQVAGFATRYGDLIDPDATTDILGQTAWLYDSLLGNTQSLSFSERSDGYAFSDIAYLDDTGMALGSYELFDTDDSFLGLRVFSYTENDGFTDLIGLIDGGLAAAGWQELSNLLLTSSDGNGAGFLVGNGVLAGGDTGLYLMTTSAVPVPPAVWLFASGLLGLFSLARRKKRV